MRLPGEWYGEWQRAGTGLGSNEVECVGRGDRSPFQVEMKIGSRSQLAKYTRLNGQPWAGCREPDTAWVAAVGSESMAVDLAARHAGCIAPKDGAEQHSPSRREPPAAGSGRRCSLLSARAPQCKQFVNGGPLSFQLRVHIYRARTATAPSAIHRGPRSRRGQPSLPSYQAPSLIKCSRPSRPSPDTDCMH